MEQVAKTDKTELTPLEQISQSELVKSLRAHKFDAIPAPTSVQDAVERGLPMVMVQRATGDESLLYAIEFEILAIAGLLNLNIALTIKPGQSATAAQVIFENFRTESLEDIKLAFKRGASGLYGEIFRLDGAVLVRWIQCYLEEKYAVIEQMQAKTKQKYSEDRPVDYDAYKVWAEGKRKTDEEKRNQQIQEKQKDAEFRMKELSKTPRQVFICDGIEVKAASEKYARMAYKEMFKREPETVESAAADSPVEPQKQ